MAKDMSSASAPTSLASWLSKASVSVAYSVSEPMGWPPRLRGNAAHDRKPFALASDRHGDMRTSVSMSLQMSAFPSLTDVPVGPSPAGISRAECLVAFRKPPSWPQ